MLILLLVNFGLFAVLDASTRSLNLLPVCMLDLMCALPVKNRSCIPVDVLLLLLLLMAELIQMGRIREHVVNTTLTLKYTLTTDNSGTNTHPYTNSLHINTLAVSILVILRHHIRWKCTPNIKI